VKVEIFQGITVLLAVALRIKIQSMFMNNAKKMPKEWRPELAAIHQNNCMFNWLCLVNYYEQQQLMFCRRIRRTTAKKNYKL
jgi:1,4-dihydroxy-2-naphthoate octaprenyltransferase